MAFALTLFARAPVAGQTKTRLIPALGAEGAAALYQAFLEDMLEHLDGSLETGSLETRAFETALSCAGNLEHPVLQRLALDHGLELRAQVAGGLGTRLSHALSRMAESHDGGVVVGTDMPTLPRALVESGVLALERADVVLGPTSDGGYYLVGSRRPWPDLFDGVRFSGPHALADTVLAARRAGARVELLAPWYDIDEPEDLRLLRAHLALDPSAASQTHACLFDRLSADR